MPKAAGLDLNERQKLFCLEYLKDFNGTQAAIRAGYSEKASAEMAYDLLRKPQIQQFIQIKTQAVEKKYDLSRERIAERYAQLVNFDVRKLYDEEGNLIPVHKLDDETATALTGLEIDESTDFITGEVTRKTKKVKLTSVKDALDSASKFMGYNMPDKVEQSGRVENVVIIQREKNG